MKYGKLILVVGIFGLFAGGGSDALAHSTGHEARTVAQCALLPGNEHPPIPIPPPANMRFWCMRCVEHGGQHFHPDCPAGHRCSPDNGAPQCGGGAF